MKKNYVMLLKKNNKKCIIIKYYDATLRELINYYLYLDTNDFKNCIEYVNMGYYKPISSDVGYYFKFYPSQDYFKEDQGAHILMEVTFINNKKVVSLRLELPMNGNYVNIERTKITILTKNPTLGEKMKEQLSNIYTCC